MAIQQRRVGDDEQKLLEGGGGGGSSSNSQRVSSYYILLLKPVLYVVVGCVIGKQCGWNLVDSAYFAVATATTVGYGDYSVMGSPTGIKVAGMAYMLVGLVVIGELISEIGEGGRIVMRYCLLAYALLWTPLPPISRKDCGSNA